MSIHNKEMQLRKTCQLYSYVLVSQGKEVPEEVQECADSNDPDCIIDCVAQLSGELKSFDSETLKKIVNNTQSQASRDLAQWWEMYQLYIPIQS